MTCSVKSQACKLNLQTDGNFDCNLLDRYVSIRVFNLDERGTRIFSVLLVDEPSLLSRGQLLFPSAVADVTVTNGARYTRG